MSTDAEFGDPFYLGVLNCNLDGTMYDFAVDGNPGVRSMCGLAALIADAKESTKEHGGAIIINWCIPVMTIENGEITDQVDGEMGMMARAAGALKEE